MAKEFTNTDTHIMLGKGLIVSIDNSTANRIGITDKQRKLITNIISEEVDKIRETLNIEHDIDITVWFSKAKSRWGNMRTLSDSNNDKRKGIMSLSLMTVQSHEYGEKLRNTIMHELLHLMPNGGSHKGKWAEYANAINRKYGYNIKRCSSGAEFDVPDEICQRVKDYKYIIYCPSCGHEWKYARMTKSVKYPHLYKCNKCEVHIERKK